MKGNPRIKILLFILSSIISLVGLETASTFEGILGSEKGQVKAAQIEYGEDDEDAVILPGQEDTRPIYDEKTESTVYSCIYFGSYPQRQVTGDMLTSEIENAKYDENGDASVDGKRYHRVENISGTSYFLYEPIKWKIIANVQGNIVAMAERGLDYCAYYDAKENAKESTVEVEKMTDEELESDIDRREAYEDVSWQNSTIRSWLNSYEEKENLANQSYKEVGAGFLSTAFSEEEQRDLLQSQDFTGSRLESYVTALPGDRVFLISLAGATHAKYGFLEKNSASPGRIVERTDYAISRGKELNDAFSEEGSWWLSSGLEKENKIQYVNQKGKLQEEGTESYHSLIARPVIVIKADSANIKEAGKTSVSNEGGVSISIQLQSDDSVSLDESKVRYKDTTISIFVKNIGKEVVEGIDASLEFENGTEILDGQNNIHFSNIEPGEQKNITWKLAVKPQDEDKTEKYTIRMIGTNLGETYIIDEIFIPKLEKEASREALEELQEEEKKNRSFLEKIRDFFRSFS